MALGARSDLDAINNYVEGRSEPAAGAPVEITDRWKELRNMWRKFYLKTTSSLYVSDADLAKAKNIRNMLMYNQNPDAWKYVQETAADKPDRKPYHERPEAPGKQKKPWEKKGLTYPKAAKPPKVPIPPTPVPTKVEDKPVIEAAVARGKFAFNAKTIGSAVVGAALGFFGGGPVGAVGGTLLGGFVGSKL